MSRFQSSALRVAKDIAQVHKHKANRDTLAPFLPSVAKRKARLGDNHTSRNRFPEVFFAIGKEESDIIAFRWNVKNNVLSELFHGEYEPCLVARTLRGFGEALKWAKAYQHARVNYRSFFPTEIVCADIANVSVLGQGEEQ